jgi:hypothetical protein
MAFLKWSFATSTLNLLKSGAINRDVLKVNILNGVQKELTKDISKRKEHNKPVTYEIFYKQVFKDETYVKLYNELGITNQLNDIIKQSIK